MKQLNDKVIVLTGAGSGIGRALAIRLYQTEHARLALADINPVQLQETVTMLGPDIHPDKVRSYPVDVAQRNQVITFANNVQKDFAAVDVLINNAGVSSSGHVNDLTYETLEWTININLWGVIHMTKALLPHLAKRAEANIVNISSVYGLLGIPGQAAYCASKFAVRGFTEALRQEFHQSNLTVSVVFPGGIQTNIARNSRTDYPVDHETIQASIRRIEAGFKTTPDEAARVIIQGIKNKLPRILIGKDAKKIDWLARINPGDYDRTIARYIAKTHH